MINDQDANSKRTSVGFDLEERTALFGEHVIRFAKSVPVSNVTGVLVRQIVRSGTSVGANYCEANEAETKKVFRQKISTCRKESKETRHWVRMIVTAVPDLREAGATLWQEAKELSAIFSSIHRNSG